MRIPRLIPFALFIGLAVAFVFAVAPPKPVIVSQATSSMRPEILQSLQQAVHLADTKDDRQALKLVDVAQSFPNKTNLEIMEINQVRGFVIDRQNDRNAERTTR